MADATQNRWRYRVLFLVLAASVIFIQLLPLNAGPSALPQPDILLLTVLCWTIIRPDLVPVALIAGIFLLTDFLMMRPPGLWAALVVLGCEFLRSRKAALRTATFPVEWALVAGVVTALVVANIVVLGLFGVPQPSLGQTVIRLVLTVLIYPLVVLFAARMFGLRKLVGDGDGLGAGR